MVMLLFSSTETFLLLADGLLLGLVIGERTRTQLPVWMRPPGHGQKLDNSILLAEVTGPFGSIQSLLLSGDTRSLSKLSSVIWPMMNLLALTNNRFWKTMHIIRCYSPLVITTEIVDHHWPFCFFFLNTTQYSSQINICGSNQENDLQSLWLKSVLFVQMNRFKASTGINISHLITWYKIIAMNHLDSTTYKHFWSRVKNDKWAFNLAIWAFLLSSSSFNKIAFSSSLVLFPISSLITAFWLFIVMSAICVFLRSSWISVVHMSFWST